MTASPRIDPGGEGKGHPGPVTPPADGRALDLKALSPSADFLRLIPRDFARQHLVLSEGRRGEAESLLAAPSTSPVITHNVGVWMDCAVNVRTVDAEQLARVIDEAYRDHAADASNGVKAGHAAIEATGGAGAGALGSDIERLVQEADKDLLSTHGKGPVVRLVDAILFEALGSSASDVHIQPTSDGTLVRYRVDGVLRTVRELPLNATSAVVSRVKVMGRMDIAERRIPQDGRAGVRIADRSIDLRISTIPTSHGERVVLRLLDHGKALADLGSIGMPPKIEADFTACAMRSNGLILVTGPTGSGKTTTLYATLKRIGAPERNIMTIEDPIEYELSGPATGLAISQSQVNTRKGVTFSTGLRHILRQDPDIVMVGEIRDLETAEMAVQASMTGHLVLSTLHTNDAPSAGTRLVDLGLEPYLVGSSLSAVLAQRLVRRRCRHCSPTLAEPPIARPQIECAMCQGSGFKGRIGLFELLIINDTVAMVLSHETSMEQVREAARRTGWMPLAEHGAGLVREGLTTPDEILRVVNAPIANPSSP